jgi:hypothetical protein
MGRFTSTDPIAGGSASAYDYSNADPVNTFDLDGSCVRIHHGRDCVPGTVPGSKPPKKKPPKKKPPAHHPSPTKPSKPHAPKTACERAAAEHAIMENRIPRHKAHAVTVGLSQNEIECISEGLGAGAPEGGDIG